MWAEVSARKILTKFEAFIQAGGLPSSFISKTHRTHPHYICHLCEGREVKLLGGEVEGVEGIYLDE